MTFEVHHRMGLPLCRQRQDGDPLNCLIETPLETPFRNSIPIEELFRQLQPKLVAYAYRFTASQDAARDVVQDAFYAMILRGEHLRQDGNLKSYLYSTVSHKCLNNIAHQKSHLAYVEWYGLNGLKSALNDNHCDIEELQAVVERAKNGLPKKCKTIFELSRDEGLSNKQIAEQLEISINTVENQMTIALRRMRQAVDKYYGKVEACPRSEKKLKKK